MKRPVKHRMDRREFLERSVSMTTALAAGGTFSRVLSANSKTHRPGGPSKKVIVIGAGLAGLSAAYELTQAGHDVTILEAQMRPGGRVLTLRQPFSDGLYAEAGAMVIPDTHDFTLKYVTLFDLPLNPPAASKLGSVAYLRKKRITVTPGVNAAYPYDLTPEEQKLGPWRTYVQPVVAELGNPAAPAWPLDLLKQYDDVTFTEFLRRRGASSGAIASLTAGFLWGDGPATVSALVMLRDAVHQNARAWFSIRGGNDLLPKAFAARLAEKIHYGSPAIQLEQDSNGVRAIFLQAGTRRTVTGDYLVCAIPFSVLRHIEISPGLSPGKKSAIKELPHFSAARVSLQFRKRFWEDEGLDGEAWTDLPIMNVHHMTADQPGPRGILQAYIGGPHARRVTGMKESERISFVLEHMERVYPRSRQHFEGGFSKSWDEDEWARGASSWYRPGQMSALWPHVMRPEGRIHFAGDHTSAWIRWMQGALQSGNRVAREISEAS